MDLTMLVADSVLNKRYDSEHQDSLESQGSFEYSQDSLGSQKSGYFSENSSSGVESDDYVSLARVQIEQQQKKTESVVKSSVVRKPASVVISGIRLDHRSYRESLEQVTQKNYCDLSPTSSFLSPETIAEDDESFDINDDCSVGDSNELKPDDSLAHECRSYFEQRRKKVQEWTDKWSSHDAKPETASTPAASLSEKLRCLRLEMRDLMEKDESLLEKLLGLHEAIETLKGRRMKDPCSSLSRRRQLEGDHRPVMNSTLEEYPDSDDGASDPPIWCNSDQEDSVSNCSSSVLQSSVDHDPDDPSKEEFDSYIPRGFVRQHVSYPPIARNRVSSTNSHDKLRQSITAPGSGTELNNQQEPTRGRSMTHPFPAENDDQSRQMPVAHHVVEELTPCFGRNVDEEKRHEVFV